MSRLQDAANKISGFLGFAAPTYFAWTVYQDGIPQNLATWGMILCLNVLGILLVYAEGNQRPYMQLGWFLSSSCVVTAILVGESPWQWGMVETTCVILCAISLLLWRMVSARAALIAYMVAFFTAGVPLMVDLWYAPLPETLWLWVTTIVTCLLSLYGARERDLAHAIVPIGAIVENALLAVLCVR